MPRRRCASNGAPRCSRNCCRARCNGRGDLGHGGCYGRRLDGRLTASLGEERIGDGCDGWLGIGRIGGCLDQQRGLIGGCRDLSR
jgi:hypothetical protein